MNGPALILASASPRRAALLRQLGLTVRIVPSKAEETLLPGLTPAAQAEQLARRKALAVQAMLPGEETLILAADTVVALEGEILGKPRDEDDAVAMLLRLAGREHEVYTGVALVSPTAERVFSSGAAVRFAAFGEQTARAYVRTGEPMDQAGAYGIQGLGGALVERVCGDYYSVVGLPLCALRRELGAFGVSIL